MPVLDRMLMMIWEDEGGALLPHAGSGDRSRMKRNHSGADTVRPSPRGPGRRHESGSHRATHNAPARYAAPGAPDAEALRGRPKVRELSPYSTAFVKVIGVFGDPAGAARARAAVLSGELPIGGANVRIERVEVVQDLTPPRVHNARPSIWQRIKCWLLGFVGPDPYHRTGGPPGDARVMVDLHPVRIISRSAWDDWSRSESEGKNIPSRAAPVYSAA